MHALLFLRLERRGIVRVDLNVCGHVLSIWLLVEERVWHRRVVHRSGPAVSKNVAVSRLRAVVIVVVEVILLLVAVLKDPVVRGLLGRDRIERLLLLVFQDYFLDCFLRAGLGARLRLGPDFLASRLRLAEDRDGLLGDRLALF